MSSSNDIYASYMIKSFGATLADLTFWKLPEVIRVAKEVIPDDDIVGFFVCALDRPPKMTGLIFCDRRHKFPPGLPAHTPPIQRRYWREGYLVIEASTGGLFVVAHWLHQNGAQGPFHVVH